MALPGQTNVNGVSNFIFGSNMAEDFSPNNVRNTPAIQAQIAAAGITVLRCAIDPGNPDSYIDETVAACAACGAQMLVILNHSNLTWNTHLVTYLGSNCNLYEFSNEPDLGGISWQQYLGFWNQHIPAMRAINTNAAFIGPALGVFANLQSYLVPWLQGCQQSGVLPDGISFHIYPCTGSNDPTYCASRAGAFASAAAKVDAAVLGVLGYKLPNCLTEWNIDASNPPASYCTDASFVTPWFHTALDSMVQGGYVMCNQFDAGSGAAGGADDLVNVSNYQPQVEYQPMADKITQYLGSGGGGGGGASNLVVYTANATSAVLSSADQMYIISGSPSTTWNYTRVGTTVNAYVELQAQGTTTITTYASLPAPTGKGYFVDGSTLDGQDVAAGIWSAMMRLNCAQGGDGNPQAGNLTADLIYRAWIYDTVALTYTPIVVMRLNAQALTMAFTTYPLPSTTTSTPTSFVSGKKLYFDRFAFISANGNGSAIQDIRTNRLSTDTSGHTGDSNSSVTSPGFAPTPGGGGGGGGTILLTDAGLNLLRDGNSGSQIPKITYVAIGTDTTPPSDGDTKLGNEKFRKAVTSYTNGATGEVTDIMFLGPNDANGITIEEVGFFGGAATDQANTGILFGRALYHKVKSQNMSITFPLDIQFIRV